ncbi:hypothetical protein OS493_022467 [Desmophyllum pertusum]|uniref:Uncharacterized protein n=1 Tax=Desmophyllum pertusum TaxID=174260 RepID=A0A9W9ZQW4_9CNID|nr:hypothetical protein OS493_022467 [Desmophyllum pertusum]
MTTFKRRHEVLESLIKSWKYGHEVLVHEVEGVSETKTDEEVSEHQGVKNMKSEKLQEDSLTTNTDEREPGTDQEVSEDVGDTKQACKLEDGNSMASLNEDTVTINDDEVDEKKSPDFSQIKMPPKILKRGRPKGAEVTVIGIPREKKKKEGQNGLLPFCKLSPIEKDRVILGSLSTALAVGEAIAGHRLLNKEDILPIGQISDTIRDDEMVDILRVEKYFDKDAWLLVMKSGEEKNRIGFVCAVCAKIINDEREDSIRCDRKESPKKENLSTE